MRFFPIENNTISAPEQDGVPDESVLSGKYWVTWADTYAKNSNAINDLEVGFRESAQLFVKALTDAGADVIISTTRRSEKRAYLFHWSWKISQNRCKASEAATMPGVDIQWDHGDADKSRRGALEMVQGFGLAVPPKSTNPPSTTSNHIIGKAIDLTITWTGTITVKKKNATEVKVMFMRDVNANTALHAIGASYDVKKLVTDAPHWSYNGR
jgi:hypothetical protein